jgi:phosphotransferase system  glucose/maltose/N-acetylglucosamine-specific IIC component
MIFGYFFAWSLAFWSFGYPQMMQAAKENNHNLRGDDDANHQQATTMTTNRNTNHSRHTTASSGELADSSPEEHTESDRHRIQYQHDPEAGDTNVMLEPKESQPAEKDVTEEQNVPSCRGSTAQSQVTPSLKSRLWNILKHFWTAFKQTTTSPGFVAMLLAFITACIRCIAILWVGHGGPGNCIVTDLYNGSCRQFGAAATFSLGQCQRRKIE